MKTRLKRNRVFGGSNEPEDEDGFHVYCPALTGCHSYGDTEEEALKNIREAIEAYLGSLKKDGLPFSKNSAKKVEVAARQSKSSRI